MLFRKDILDKIFHGEIKAAYRMWKKPTVKAGGTLRTPKGVLKIKTLKKIEKADIRPHHIQHAGYATFEELLEEIGTHKTGTLYHITFEKGPKDPRKKLQTTKLTAKAADRLALELGKMDLRHKKPWTTLFLKTIDQHPGKPAELLAKKVKWEKLKFKSYVRKLKEKGLTISLETGYKLSPRGKAYLRLSK